jgi:hypothetical protein
MTSRDASNQDDGHSFAIEIKLKTHIHGADWEALRQRRERLHLNENIVTQLQRRVSQAGGQFSFDLSDLSPELREAAYLYLGSATYAFESNPGYRYSAIRFAARKSLVGHGLRPISTVLRGNGVAVWSEFTVDRVELGSINFWQRIQLIVTITGGISGFAATAPTAYHNIENIYLPIAQKISTNAIQYMGDYFETLQKLGIDVEYEIPPLELPIMPERPVIHRRPLRDGTD